MRYKLRVFKTIYNIYVFLRVEKPLEYPLICKLL